ncbi:MAG: GatB/YqeY domain-containing protein [Candidatus Kapaibacteriales bacterium]
MSLEERINEELKKAIKSGDQIRMNTLRSLRASIIEFHKSGINREINFDDELKILQSAVKKRKDAIELYQKGNRMDMVEVERKELQIIEEFLPPKLSENEIQTRLQEIISELGATSLKDLGKVMGKAMNEFKGKADGSVVQKIAKELLETVSK